jgi:molecular chaperone DnaJ
MDPYKTLGVSKNASADEIKKAYRKLAHQHHPDKKTGDSAKFKEINEAYQILSDPKKRTQYDQFGFAGNGSYSGGQQGGSGFGGFGGGQGGGFWDFFGGSGAGNTGGFEDIFDMFSGSFGGGQREEASKGEDMYLEVQVSKKELGTTRRFEFSAQMPCKDCETTGVAKGHKMKTCEVCNGAGRVRQNIQTPFGNFTQVAGCGQCRGKGKVPEKLCPTCKGSGRMEGKRKMEVQLPEDLEDGYQIIVPKGGNAGKEGKPAGDLLITIRVK